MADSKCSECGGSSYKVCSPCFVAMRAEKDKALLQNCELQARLDTMAESALVACQAAYKKGLADATTTEKRVEPAPKVGPPTIKTLKHCAASVDGCLGVDNCSCTCQPCDGIRNF